jgi:hypothetical protein
MGIMVSFWNQLYGLARKWGRSMEAVSVFPIFGGQWVLLSADGSFCDERYHEKLYLMHPIRLTQGKNAGRIERIWLVKNAKRPSIEYSAAYRGTRAVVMPAQELRVKLPGGKNQPDYLRDRSSRKFDDAIPARCGTQLDEEEHCETDPPVEGLAPGSTARSRYK